MIFILANGYSLKDKFISHIVSDQQTVRKFR